MVPSYIAPLDLVNCKGYAKCKYTFPWEFEIMQILNVTLKCSQQQSNHHIIRVHTVENFCFLSPWPDLGVFDFTKTKWVPIAVERWWQTESESS